MGRRTLQTLLLAAVVLCVLVAVQGPCTPERRRPIAATDTKVDRWETVTDEAAGFSVELPAPVTSGSATVRISPDASASLHRHDGQGMALMWFAYPEPFTKTSPVQAELEDRVAAVFTHLLGVGVTVSSEPATVAGQEGAFLRVSPGRGMVRVFAVGSGPRVYLLAASVDEKWHPKDEERMVRSFRLVPSP